MHITIERHIENKKGSQYHRVMQHQDSEEIYGVKSVMVKKFAKG